MLCFQAAFLPVPQYSPKPNYIAVPTDVTTLKTVSSVCFNITSQGGISSPRASRSRELSFPLLVSARSLLTYSPLPRRYNPVLGEFFRCRYDYPNGTQAFYIAEQGANRFLGVFTSLQQYPYSFHLGFVQFRTTHLYPHSIMYHQRTRSPSSANSGQSPNFSAIPSRRRWRARVGSRSQTAPRTQVKQNHVSPTPIFRNKKKRRVF
jgi:hypothetical protein